MVVLHDLSECTIKSRIRIRKPWTQLTNQYVHISYSADPPREIQILSFEDHPHVSLVRPPFLLDEIPVLIAESTDFAASPICLQDFPIFLRSHFWSWHFVNHHIIIPAIRCRSSEPGRSGPSHQDCECGDGDPLEQLAGSLWGAGGQRWIYDDP